MEHNILNGMGVYVAFATLALFAVYLGTCLPSKLWDENEPTLDAIYDWVGLATHSEIPNHLASFQQRNPKSFNKTTLFHGYSQHLDAYELYRDLHYYSMYKTTTFFDNFLPNTKHSLIVITYFIIGSL